MKYLIFNTKNEAIEEAEKIYRSYLYKIANQHEGSLHMWINDSLEVVNINDVPKEQINGDFFPIYGKRASDFVTIIDSGHTKRWADPIQIRDGRWIIPSPDDNGVASNKDWFINEVTDENLL